MTYTWRTRLTLDRLFVLMVHGNALEWRGAGLPVDANGDEDWSSVPTFGGPKPTSTDHVWSWDETRMIVGTCPDDLSLVPR